MRLTFDDGQRVLGQGFAFRPAWWQRSYLPGAWSRWLDTLPEDPGVSDTGESNVGTCSA